MDGIHGIDPKLEDEGAATMQIGSGEPQLKSVGPDAYEPWPSATRFSDVSVPDVKWMLPPRPRFFRASTSRTEYWRFSLLCPHWHVSYVTLPSRQKERKGLAERRECDESFRLPPGADVASVTNGAQPGDSQFSAATATGCSAVTNCRPTRHGWVTRIPSPVRVEQSAVDQGRFVHAHRHQTVSG